MALITIVTKQAPTNKEKNTDKVSKKNSLENSTKFGYKCVCLNARSIVNKINELNVMAERSHRGPPPIYQMTEHLMFRKDRTGRRLTSWATTDISDDRTFDV